MDKMNEEVLTHPHITIACEILGIQKEWINDDLFYMWPIKDQKDDLMTALASIVHDVKLCGYTFSSFKAIVITPEADADTNTDNSFIYFYGRCVTNPRASTYDWQFSS